MEYISLFIGLGIGILFGFMLGERGRWSKSDEPTEFARLLKQATEDLNKDESVSITMTAGKWDGDNDDEDDDPADDPLGIKQGLLDKWRWN